jgi:hypothetical protein
LTNFSSLKTNPKSELWKNNIHQINPKSFCVLCIFSVSLRCFWGKGINCFFQKVFCKILMIVKIHRCKHTPKTKVHQPWAAAPQLWLTELHTSPGFDLNGSLWGLKEMLYSLVVSHFLPFLSFSRNLTHHFQCL